MKVVKMEVLGIELNTIVKFTNDNYKICKI